MLARSGCQRRCCRAGRSLLYVEKPEPVLGGGGQGARPAGHLVETRKPLDRLRAEATCLQSIQEFGFADAPLADTKDRRFGAAGGVREAPPIIDERAISLEIDRPLARRLTPPASGGQKPRSSGSSSSRTRVRIAACGTTR